VRMATKIDLPSTPVSPEGSLSLTPLHSRTPLSQQKVRGRRLVRKDRCAAYRRIENLENQVRSAERRAEMYRKRLTRSSPGNPGQSQATNDIALETSHETPRKLTRKTMLSPRKTRKTLLLYYSIADGVKRAERRDKRITASVLCAAKLVKKHRLLSLLRHSIGVARSQRTRSYDGSGFTGKDYIRRRMLGPKRLVVMSFFEQDDVSRPTAGKKETVTRCKMKKQKRFLLEPVSKLYVKFRKRNSHVSMSRSTFAKMKPFWVKSQRIDDRETCLCKLHENSRFQLEKLQQLKLLPAGSLSDVISAMVCNTSVKECMFGECPKCRGCEPQFQESSIQQCPTVYWWKWQAVTEIIENHSTRRTVKQKVAGTLIDLKTDFLQHVKLLKPHSFRIAQQYTVITEKKKTLSDSEVLIHIDFSENWTIKKPSAVMPAHFGASNQQVTLHTGIAYFTKHPDMSFCSISDHRDHGPVAVWSHLLPVLKCIKTSHPQVDTLHVQSDGPTTQYRNRLNFFLTSVVPFHLGFKKVWWNFSEAAHGKGPADGVGAGIKRLADNSVLAGHHIDSAVDLFGRLYKSGTKVKLFLIDKLLQLSDDIQVPAFPGTMKIHQVFVGCTGIINYRELSCYCRADKFCHCFLSKKVIINVGDISTVFPHDTWSENGTSDQVPLLPPSHSDTASVTVPFAVNVEALLSNCRVMNVDARDYYVLDEYLAMDEQVHVALASHVQTEQMVDNVINDSQPLFHQVVIGTGKPAVESIVNLMGDTQPVFEQPLQEQQSVEQSMDSCQIILHHSSLVQQPGQDSTADLRDDIRPVSQQCSQQMLVNKTSRTLSWWSFLQ